ncbi:MAG: cob(I)yrinic acid a,c-diamide adenosyltransferase [Clostridiales bacterium]|nr:cob(I)yrinic acid a,c-diamide adenosyltransferase [Clostridiales bacterium]
MIHIYYGDGKGKTSAALGLSIRACGAEKKVLFVSFLKDNSSSERTALCDIEFYESPQSVPFLFNMTRQEKDEYSKWVRKAVEDAFSSSADVIVLDEFLDAVSLFDKDEIEKLDFDSEKEYVITGHIKNDFLFDKADYITNMKKEKYPFDEGISARLGIEF